MSTINPRTVLAFQWHHKGGRMRYIVLIVFVLALAAGCGSAATSTPTQSVVPVATTSTSPSPSTSPTPTPTPTLTHTVVVAPPAPATRPAKTSPAATAPAASCYPLSNGGNCYEPGEYCRKSDHGASGVAGDGKKIICENNDGWRWEPI
jgi:hypothetical protein